MNVCVCMHESNYSDSVGPRNEGSIITGAVVLLIINVFTTIFVIIIFALVLKRKLSYSSYIVN